MGRFSQTRRVQTDTIESNTFETEWPPRSGKTARFPEVDRSAWFDPETAKQEISPAQAALIIELMPRDRSRSDPRCARSRTTA